MSERQDSVFYNINDDDDDDSSNTVSATVIYVYVPFLHRLLGNL